MSVLQVDRLSAGYGKAIVLHDVSLAVEPGQFVTIIGPNGSGKSTLIKTIFGLTNVFSGAITYDRTPLVGLPTEAISRLGIAYVPQVKNIFTSMTVYENLLLATRRLPPDQTRQRLEESYALFPILHQRRTQRSGLLSGGERQMLAIAMGWLPRPRLMLLDEPTAALSPLLVTEILRLLRRLCDSGITLVVVEQNARSALRWCDYGYVLREGQVAFGGTAAEISADEATARQYLGVAPIKRTATAARRDESVNQPRSEN